MNTNYKLKLEWDCLDKSLLDEYVQFMTNRDIDANTDAAREKYEQIVDKITFNLIANSKKDLVYGDLLKIKVRHELMIISLESVNSLMKNVLKDFDEDLKK